MADLRRQVKWLMTRILPAPAYRRVLDLKHYLHRPEDLHLTYSQEGEEIIAWRFLGFRRTGFYVDVGAHDPRRFSNTHFLYRSGWRGINIEPNPSAVAEFRVERPRDLNLCVAIGEATGFLTYYMFPDGALNTLDARVAEKRASEGKGRPALSLVPVRRLDDVLGEHLGPSQGIDVLTIDVEGFDLAVLRSNDWRRFRPTLVLVEHWERDLERLMASTMHQYMAERDYTLVAKTYNTCFYRDRLTRAPARSVEGRSAARDL